MENKLDINEMYMQIPKEERLALRKLAKLIGIKSENKIRESVVENWRIKERIGEQHESEK